VTIETKGVDKLMLIVHNGTVYKQFEADDREQIMNELNAIVNDVYQQGKVIKLITIDGVDVTGSVESFLVSNLNPIQNIEVHSVTPDEIIDSLYADIVDYLGKVSKATDAISDMFYGDVNMDAWNQLSQLSEALGFTIEALQTIIAHGQHHAGQSSFANEVTVFIDEVKTHVAEINQAIEDQDFVLVGDVIRYELGKSVSRMLNSMVSRVEQ